MKGIDTNHNSGRLLSIIVLGFAFLWGALAWFDWFFITGRSARTMEGGILFSPHLILLLLGAIAFSLLALFAFHIHSLWRLFAALVPASYVVFRLF